MSTDFQFRRLWSNKNPGKVARNTVWMTLGLGLRVLIQLGYFVLIARALGVSRYGAFTAAVALVAVITPFAGWGWQGLLVREIARYPEHFGAYWARALTSLILTSLILCGLAVGLSRLILPSEVGVYVVLMVALSDLLFAQLVEFAARVFQARERLKLTSGLRILLALARLAAIMLMFFVLKSNRLAVWAGLYLATSVVSALIAVRLVHVKVGAPSWAAVRGGLQWRDGWHFAVGPSAYSIYSDIDKTLLARLASVAAAGFYSAGYRVMDAVFTPVNALLAAANARFYQQGLKGSKAVFDYAGKLVPAAFIYAAVAGAAMYAGAPLIPEILGKDYNNVVHVAHWFAVMPIIMVVSRFGAAMLNGAGLQRGRSNVQIAAAVFNVGLNVWLIPEYSWRGAVWATLLTELLLAVSFAIIILVSVDGAGAPSG